MNLSKKKTRLITLSVCIVISMLIALSCAVSIVGNSEVAQGAVITASSADFISDELLLSTRTDTAVGGKVFDKAVLNKIYEKLAGSGATFSTVETKARVAKAAYSSTSVKAIHSGMNSGDIRTANNNKNIVVKLGGKEWIVTALTTKNLSSSSDVILTLMLKDVIYNSKWAAWSSSNGNDYSAKYPTAMYSTSYARAGLLNGSVQYTTNGADLASLTANEKTSLYGASGYPFSIFTETLATGSITSFLVAPKDVLYQQDENLYDVEHSLNSDYYTSPNGASLNKIDNSKWYTALSSTCRVRDIQDKTNYFDWGSDLIWLPSQDEMGHAANSNNANGGLWNLDNAQRGVSANKITWTRSGGYNTSGNVRAIGTGGGDNGFTANSTTYNGATFAMRPAIHLNLTAANNSAVSLIGAPSDVTPLTYNGTPLSFNSGFDTPANTPIGILRNLLL